MSLLLTLRISVEPPVNPSRDARAAGLERHLALLLDDAEYLLGAVLGEPLPGRDAGQLLVLAEILRDALLLEVVEPGIERHHRDSRRLRRGHRRSHRVRLGEGHRDTGHLGVDRGLHQVGLVRRLRIRRVTQLDIVLRRGRLGALANQIPERITRHLVGDHRDGHPLGIRLTRADPTPGILRLTAGARAGAEECGDRCGSDRCGDLACAAVRWGCVVWGELHCCVFHVWWCDGADDASERRTTVATRLSAEGVTLSIAGNRNGLSRCRRFGGRVGQHEGGDAVVESR